jgi:hypothetical protein
MSDIFLPSLPSGIDQEVYHALESMRQAIVELAGRVDAHNQRDTSAGQIDYPQNIEFLTKIQMSWNNTLQYFGRSVTIQDGQIAHKGQDYLMGSVSLEQPATPGAGTGGSTTVTITNMMIIYAGVFGATGN